MLPELSTNVKIWWKRQRCAIFQAYSQKTQQVLAAKRRRAFKIFKSSPPARRGRCNTPQIDGSSTLLPNPLCRDLVDILPLADGDKNRRILPGVRDENQSVSAPSMGIHIPATALQKLRFRRQIGKGEFGRPRRFHPIQRPKRDGSRSALNVQAKFVKRRNAHQRGFFRGLRRKCANSSSNASAETRLS